MGLVGAVELVAAIQECLARRAAVSILLNWYVAPMMTNDGRTRRYCFPRDGVRTVLSQGSLPCRLRSVDAAGVTIGDLSTAAHTPIVQPTGGE